VAIRIIKEVSEDSHVEFDTIIQIIETNRDRVRTIGNMILTVSGIVLSATFGILLFIFDKGGLGRMKVTILVVLFGGAVLTNLLSVYLSIASSFLRTTYSLTTKVNLVTDLMALLNSELRLVRLSFLFLIAGLLLITTGTVAFVCMKWPR